MASATLAPSATTDRFTEIAACRRIKLAELMPDLKNRELKQWFVDKLIKTFDFKRWTPPVVRENANDDGEWDGTYTIVEGHHHVAAAIACPQVGPDREVVCYVHPPVKDDGEVGRIYAGINDVVHHSSTEKFLIRLREGQTQAVATAALIEKSAWEGISTHRRNGHVHVPAALEWLYKGGATRSRTTHPEAVTFALACAADLYGTRPEAIRPEFIQGFGLFHMRYPGAALGDVVANVRTEYPRAGDLKAAADQWHNATRTQKRVAVGQLMRQAYNKGRRTKKLPPWDG